MNRYQDTARHRILGVIEQEAMTMERWQKLVDVVAHLVEEEVAHVANRAQIAMIEMKLVHDEEVERVKSQAQDDRATDPCTVTIRRNGPSIF